MRENGIRIRITLEVNEADLELLESAAHRFGTSPSVYARYAALRMARQDVALESAQATTGAADGSNRPSRRSLRPAIQRATIPTFEIVRQLQTHLGDQLLAITVGAEIAEVQRWASETSEPSSVQERRLREAHDAWQLVVSVESPNTTRAWWMGMKDGLDDLSPAEAIAQDRARDVMAVARYFIEAG